MRGGGALTGCPYRWFVSRDGWTDGRTDRGMDCSRTGLHCSVGSGVDKEFSYVSFLFTRVS